MGFTRVQVTGSFLDGDGKAARNVQVVGQASSSMENAGMIAINDPIIGSVNSSGALVDEEGMPYTAPATDDPGTAPSGVIYEWTVQVDSGPMVTGRGPLSRLVSPVDIWSFLDFDA